MNVAPGLRERKKEATRQTLHEAAVRLAVEQGLENLTVEAIADAAGVSRRTFSNYFDGKEEALLYSDQSRLRRLLELVEARPADEPPWTALAGAARDLVAEGVADARWVAQMRLLRRHPALLTEQVATYATIERALAVSIAARLPDAAGSPSPAPGPDDAGASLGGVGPDGAGVSLGARLVATTFLATLRVTVQHWLDHPDASLASVLDAVLALARSPVLEQDPLSAGDSGHVGPVNH